MNMLDVQDDIILAFKQGDRSAFNTIYRQLRKPIITFCKYMVSIEDAEEITTDIFVRLWRSRDKWDGIKNIKAFLYISARNACLNFLKSQKAKPRKQEAIDEVLEREPEMIQQSEIESDLITMIKQEIENLSDTCRSVFKLSYLEGYENAEIAQKLNISYQTVKNLKSIALTTIKKNLAGKGLQLSTILLLLQVIKRFS
jgi:RNA polymerase sigma-70 factor (ECF subfamily)